MRCEGVAFVHVAHDKNEWEAVLDSVMKLWFP